MNKIKFISPAIIAAFVCSCSTSDDITEQIDPVAKKTIIGVTVAGGDDTKALSVPHGADYNVVSLADMFATKSNLSANGGGGADFIWTSEDKVLVFTEQPGKYITDKTEASDFIITHGNEFSFLSYVDENGAYKEYSQYAYFELTDPKNFNKNNDRDNQIIAFYPDIKVEDMDYMHNFFNKQTLKPNGSINYRDNLLMMYNNLYDFNLDHPSNQIEFQHQTALAVINIENSFGDLEIYKAEMHNADGLGEISGLELTFSSTKALISNVKATETNMFTGATLNNIDTEIPILGLRTVYMAIPAAFTYSNPTIYIYTSIGVFGKTYKSDVTTTAGYGYEFKFYLHKDNLILI